MITIPSKSELKTLMTTTGDWCVSFYMPTHPVGPEGQQDPVRLRKWLKSAEKQLVKAGMRVPDANALLQPAWELVDQPGFWREQEQSLAIFIAPGITHYYQLPIPVKRLLTVANRFELKPLLPLTTDEMHFYILALSQNKVELLEGTRYQVKPIELTDTPKSKAEALQVDDTEQQLQWHSSTDAPGAPGKRAAVFYGVGGGADDVSKTDLLRFFQQVDKGLHKILANEHAPLVLAGVDYLLPIYREANSYPRLVVATIHGNSDRLRPEDLHAEARRILEPRFRAAQTLAVERYQQFAGNGSGLASADLRQILQASLAARVETLFVPSDVQQWGKYDPMTDTMELSEAPRVGDQDLLDLAAIQTYLNGGTVFALKLKQIPSHELIAAVFRY